MKNKFLRRLLCGLTDLAAVAVAGLCACLTMSASPSPAASRYAVAFYTIALAVDLAVLFTTDAATRRRLRERPLARCAYLFSAAGISCILSSMIVLLSGRLVRDTVGVAFFSWTGFIGVPIGVLLAAAVLFVRTIALPSPVASPEPKRA